MSNYGSEKLVEAIIRKTRHKYSAEEKIRIVLDGLREEGSSSELNRRGGINQNVFYHWSKEFLEVGIQCLAGEIKREANTEEVVQHVKKTIN